ncbi:hypothetical protein VP424E501_P0300 [Vibrio phage 424E50-1]|nr:hypothetical protein VP501E541_P0282 [Vibrio phage 501E54-1]CAH9015300.1 hypothetical protein VP424E501_P0300 [Vibrio phage 424E50-1]
MAVFINEMMVYAYCMYGIMLESLPYKAKEEVL